MLHMGDVVSRVDPRYRLDVVRIDDDDDDEGEASTSTSAAQIALAIGLDADGLVAAHRRAASTPSFAALACGGEAQPRFAMRRRPGDQGVIATIRRFLNGRAESRALDSSVVELFSRSVCTAVRLDPMPTLPPFDRLMVR